MTRSRQSLGRWGEKQAGNYLLRSGYEILERNFRCEQGEIDLVACRDSVIVFVEVKTRSSRAFGDPEAAVDETKIQRLSAAAETYLQEQADPDVECRIDVIAVRHHSGRPAEIRHYENVEL